MQPHASPSHFRRSPQLNCWEARFRFRDRDVDVHIDADADAPVHNLAATATAAMTALNDSWATVERALLDDLHELYNQVWRDPRASSELSEREFLDRLVIESINIESDGSVRLDFDESDLFAGRWFSVAWRPGGSLSVSF